MGFDQGSSGHSGNKMKPHPESPNSSQLCGGDSKEVQGPPRIVHQGAEVIHGRKGANAVGDSPIQARGHLDPSVGSLSSLQGNGWASSTL